MFNFAFNCGIGAERVQHVIWWVHHLRCFSVIIWCGVFQSLYDAVFFSHYMIRCFSVITWYAVFQSLYDALFFSHYMMRCFSVIIWCSVFQSLYDALFFIHYMMRCFSVITWCGVFQSLHDAVFFSHYMIRCFSVIIWCATNNLYQDSPEDIASGLIKIASCFKQGNNVFIWGILPRDDIYSINRLLIKETNILKSLCSVNHIHFIDQDANWTQMSGSFKPDLFCSDKLHVVEKGNLVQQNLFIFHWKIIMDPEITIS